MKPSAVDRLLRKMPGILDIYNRAPRSKMKRDIASLVYVFFNGGFCAEPDCRIHSELPGPVSDRNTLHLFATLASRPESPVVSSRLLGTTAPHHPMVWDMIEECARRLYVVLEPGSREKPDGAVGDRVITYVYRTRKTHPDQEVCDVILHPYGKYYLL